MATKQSLPGVSAELQQHLIHAALYGRAVGAEAPLALLIVTVVAVDDGTGQRIDVVAATGRGRPACGTAVAEHLVQHGHLLSPSFGVISNETYRLWFLQSEQFSFFEDIVYVVISS